MAGNDEAVLEAPEHEPAHISPIPVHGDVTIIGRASTSEAPADFGSYKTIVLVGTEDKQQIMPEDPQRVRGYVLVSGTGPVFVGSEAQCAAIKGGGPVSAGGAQLATGQTLTVGHKQPLWLVGDGSHSATVVVVQERMAR